MKKVKQILMSIVAICSIASPLLVTGSSYALFENAKDQACAGANLNDTGCTATQGQDKVSNTLASIINILSLVVGVVAVIMLIIGGIRFVTSGGDSSSVTNARNTIIYALVGIAVAALAQGLVKFVLSKVS